MTKNNHTRTIRVYPMNLVQCSVEEIVDIVSQLGYTVKRKLRETEYNFEEYEIVRDQIP